MYKILNPQVRQVAIFGFRVYNLNELNNAYNVGEGGRMKLTVDIDHIKPEYVPVYALEKIGEIDFRLERMEIIMATLMEVVNDVRVAVTARFDREIAKSQQALKAKQDELDALKVAEDAEDVEQNAQIAKLEAEVAAQTDAIASLEELKANMNSDLNSVSVGTTTETTTVVVADGGMVPPAEETTTVAPVEETTTVSPDETTTVFVEETTTEAPVAVEPAPVDQPIFVEDTI